MEKINILLITPKTLASSLVQVFEISDILGRIYIDCVVDNFPFMFDKNYIEIIKLKNIEDFKLLIQQKNINLVIITEILPTQKGLVNISKYNLGIPTIGITRYWSWLEKSKLFSKRFMSENSIPTPEYKIVKNLKDLKTCILKFGFPLLLKDNGLKYGFGSYICKDEKTCIKTAKKLLKENTFFIAEKFIKGKEITLHTIWDGNNLIALAPVKDYKRLKNNDEGINTGSMGSYAPAKLSDNQIYMIEKYVNYLETIFRKLKPNFTGIFASDLIFNENELYNLEFNMRPCTPEFELLCEHIDDDLLKILYDTALSQLSKREIKYKQGRTGAVNIVHNDYVKHSLKKRKVKIPAEIFSNNENIKIHHNLLITNKKDEYMIYPFGKILTLVKNDSVNPFSSIYKEIEKIKDKNIYYRTDIGLDL